MALTITSNTYVQLLVYVVCLCTMLFICLFCCVAAVQTNGARYADGADTSHHGHSGAAAIPCSQVRDGVGGARWVG